MLDSACPMGSTWGLVQLTLERDTEPFLIERKTVKTKDKTKSSPVY